MDKSKVANYFLGFLLLVLLYLAFLTVLPLLSNIILAFVLAFLFYPVYEYIRKRLKNSNISASVMIIIILLIILIPGSLVIDSLITQTSNAYSFASKINLESINDYVPSFLGDSFDANKYVSEIVFKIRDFVLSSAPSVIGSVAETILGLFVMFFVMFYAFRDGKDWISKLKENLPLKKKYTEKLFRDARNILDAVIYGYFLTALIQGSLGGLLFFILGIPNPVFWGFVMIILALLPFLGTPIVWIPAAIIELIGGRYASGIILLVIGSVVLMNIDNYLRPTLISSRSNVHPVIILLGVIGGMIFFGFVGIILGPLILTLLLVITKFFVLEVKS